MSSRMSLLAKKVEVLILQSKELVRLYTETKGYTFFFFFVSFS